MPRQRTEAQKAKRRADYQANRETLNARRQRARSERRSVINEKRRQHAAEHREEINARQRAYYADNPDRFKTYQERYYEKASAAAKAARATSDDYNEKNYIRSVTRRSGRLTDPILNVARTIGRPGADGFVYLIVLVPELDNKRLKLGYSKNPRQRFDMYRTCCPNMSLLELWGGNQTDETRLLRSVPGRIGKSETFDCNPDEARSIIDAYFTKVREETQRKMDDELGDWSAFDVTVTK